MPADTTEKDASLHSLEAPPLGNSSVALRVRLQLRVEKTSRHESVKQRVGRKFCMSQSLTWLHCKLLANVLVAVFQGNEFISQACSFHELHRLRGTFHVSLGLDHEFFEILDRHRLNDGV